MTYNHTIAKEIANGGFSQKVPSPSNPSSNQAASYYSAKHAAVLALSHTTAASALNLPKGAFITRVDFFPGSAAFSTGAKVQLGSAAAGTDILAATAIDGAAFSDLPAANQIATSGQVLHATITGAPAAGSGTLVVEYFNTDSTPGSQVG